MTKKMHEEREPSDLEAACGRAVAARRKLRTFEARNEEIVQKHRELLAMVETAKDEVKTEARKLSVTGETKVLVETKDIYVAVQGKQVTRWQVEKVEETWPPEAHEALVVTVDADEVERLLKKGVLRKEQVDEARELAPATPAVTIRLP